MDLEGTTIAIVVARTGDYYGKPVVRGIAHALSGSGARLIALTGEEWSASPRPRNAIYDLLDPRTFDGGIVLGGTLFHERGAAESFRSRYRDIPLVSIGAELPDAASVLADNATGVRQAVGHLAALGRRRIAFIRGPTGNTDATERYRGYREGLELAGLGLDPDLIAPGAFVELSGIKAVDLLLDERGASPDAIVAANDETARGALEALQRRGVVVPDDVAIVGFDDVADAELCRPKLTTVAQPLVEEGVQAALQLGRLLGGEAVDSKLLLDTHLVYRDSCGGRGQAPGRPALSSLGESDSVHAWLDGQFRILWPWLMRRAGWSRIDEGPVREALGALLQTGLPAERLTASVELAVRRTQLGEAWRWFRGLDELLEMLPAAVDDSRRAPLLAALERTKRLVTEHLIADRVRENHRSRVELESALRLTGDLLSVRGRSQMLEALRLNLAAHPNVSGYHLSLHEDDATWSRLVMSSTERDASIDRGVRFLTRTVLPQSAFPSQHATTLCGAPLSDGQGVHGMLLVEAPLDEFVRIHPMAEQIGIWLGARRRDAEPTGPRASPVDEIPERIGAYPVKGRIGAGGMATVYLAEMRVAGVPRPVALKLLHPHLRDRVASEQFVEEARVTAAIRHPNVVQVLELGEHERGMFLVMDYIDGLNLGDLLAREKSGSGAILPLRVAGRILADALSGLAAAHDLRDADGFPVNLVHRDVSLQNILVGRDGVTRLTDFGIARRRSWGNTQTGVVKGKLRYMSPEQATGAPLDRRADVWSMGVVAWEIFVGRRLYGEETDVEILRQILTRVPPSVAEMASVPAEVAEVVSRALKAEVDERLESANAFRTALVHAFREHGGLADSEEVAERVRSLLDKRANTIPVPARPGRAPG